MLNLITISPAHVLMCDAIFNSSMTLSSLITHLTNLARVVTTSTSTNFISLSPPSSSSFYTNVIFFKEINTAKFSDPIHLAFD
jgi:hypothetical protein